MLCVIAMLLSAIIIVAAIALVQSNNNATALKEIETLRVELNAVQQELANYRGNAGQTRTRGRYSTHDLVQSHELTHLKEKLFSFQMQII